MNPAALSISDLARILSVASGQELSESMVHEAISAGAPVNKSGTINLIEFMAWLELQLK